MLHNNEYGILKKYRFNESVIKQALCYLRRTSNELVLVKNSLLRIITLNFEASNQSPIVLSLKPGKCNFEI